MHRKGSDGDINTYGPAKGKDIPAPKYSINTRSTE